MPDIDVRRITPLSPERGGQRVVADHPDRRQLRGQPVLAVVAPGEEDVRAHFVAGRDLEIGGNVSQHPAALAGLERARDLDVRAALCDESVHHLGGLRVLDRLVVLGHDAKDNVAILAHHEAKSFDGASILPTDPPQTDFPRQTGVPKHLRRRLQLVHLYPETMPRGFTRVREL